MTQAPPPFSPGYAPGQQAPSVTAELPTPPSYPPPGPPFLSAPSPQRRPRRAGFAVAVLTGALLVGGGAGVAGAALYDSASGGSSSANGNGSSLSVVDNGNKPAASGSVESVASAVLPSVVAIGVNGGGASGTGSGVILDTNGLILTNDHVVTLGGQIPSEQAEVTVSFNNGKKARATVVGTDPLTDTALIKVDGVDGLKPVTIGKSSNLDVGEQVVAIGSPFGLDATVTSGIVSALDRPVEVARDAQGNATAYPAIQTDAAINPGNSGGPLVNMDGQLVGINASIKSAAANGSSESGSIGLGFAIPIDEVLPIIEQLKAGETPTHARLGIQVSDAAGSAGSSDSTLSGARIEKIEQGSAAGDAGLQQGDVITAIGDHQIASTEGLIATVRSYRPGDSVKITYLRNNKESSTELKLGSDS